MNTPAKTLEQRAQEFYDELAGYVEKYNKDMLRDFYDYWTEPNKSCTKMRFELEQTWDTARRLATWAKRDKTYNKPQQNNGYTSKFGIN